MLLFIFGTSAHSTLFIRLFAGPESKVHARLRAVAAQEISMGMHTQYVIRLLG